MLSHNGIWLELEEPQKIEDHLDTAILRLVRGLTTIKLFKNIYAQRINVQLFHPNANTVRWTNSVLNGPTNSDPIV